jgi:two-component system sensor histidine kinase QseC
MIGVLAWFSAEDEIAEVYDAQLMNTAVQLWSMAKTTDQPNLQNLDRNELGLNSDDQGDLAEYARGRTYRVWKDGRLDMASANAPPASEAPLPVGMHSVGTGRHIWRTYTLAGAQSHIIVEVRERLRARHEVSDRIVFDLLLPLLMILPVIGVATWGGIRWGLKDLRGFAKAVHERSPNDLARLDESRAPRELRPLSESINGLFGKLESSLAQQRLFTDNAAHELRTPLAALNIQIDVARNARSAKERETTLDELGQGVRRASRLLDQLLTLARLQHTTEASLPVNVYAAASEVMKDAYPKANKRHVELALSGDQSAVTHAQPALLALLVGNLVDNAIKYSPEGGVVDIAVTSEGDETRLTLCDQGAGIPESERERVFARFYRIAGNTTAGSGLGLSIVRVIADMLGAGVSLFTPTNGRGLGVEVRLKQ